MAAGGEMRPAYLIAGSDEGKIEAALARLRARAEREGGPGALESFGSPDGVGPPDAEALIAAIPSLSLIASHRYLLADRLERLNAAGVESVAEALGTLGEDVTVVLVERHEPGPGGRPSRVRVEASVTLARAVEAAGGEVLRYEAPSARQLPARLVDEARRLGFALEQAAARELIERLGEGTVRLGGELARLALWAGPGGEVTLADLQAMVADTSEEVAWTLSDAIVAGDPAAAVRASERLVAQGEGTTGLVYQAARRLRDAHRAAVALEEGRPRKQVEAELGMHPYAAKMLMRRLQGISPEELRAATIAIADLEWWTRGGSDYPADLALTLSVLRAAAREEA